MRSTMIKSQNALAPWRCALSKFDAIDGLYTVCIYQYTLYNACEPTGCQHGL